MHGQTIAAAIAFALLPAGAACAEALAQTAPIRAPSPAASPSATPVPTPAPFKLIGLQGYGDAGYTSVNATVGARFVNGNPSRVFDASTGPYYDANGGKLLLGASDFNRAVDLQDAEGVLSLNGSQFSGRVEANFGSDANVMASNGQARGYWNITQAFAQANEGALTVILGKFETEAGAELIESPLNTNFSRSYLFGYAVPFTHTGARLTYAIGPKVSVIAGVNDGWDDWKFAGKKKTIEGGISLNPSPAISWLIDTYNGNDFALGGNSAGNVAPVYTNRMLYDSVLTVHATSALTLVANEDNGTQLPDSGAYFPVAAHWNGVAGYANYTFSSRYALSLRKETFHDTDGFRTGLTPGVRLQSSTATLSFTPSSNVIFRAEYRVDGADQNAFTFENANGFGRTHQTSIGLEAIDKYP